MRALPAVPGAGIVGPEQVGSFIRDGFVRVEGMFSREVARRCLEIMWPDTGCVADDPATWAKPLVRLPGYDVEPFRSIMRMPVLENAFDRLVGPGRWGRGSDSGTIQVRFPHPDPPHDDYWHFEGSYLPEGWSGHSFTNYRSRGRALFLFVLFTDVSGADAPTRIRVGSHLAVPARLFAYGEQGLDATRIAETGILEATTTAPITCATGHAGDIYLCHPFLIHAAQAHHGSTPRFMATPALQPASPLEIDRPDGNYSPVEAAIRLGLGR
ncbi:phytanoyl-CoA dioxygenase family protein [Nocardia seriolae]|uniref:phytanoyl-CoA dioxygenase family protein n=1 Tax=Nocardia seriolae TaxID=37332 RepID=UPI0005EEF201|nr:phytanoyl-CoA dioxygenase family protein [Nocardia seriolae]QUN15894.1 phytanoyl-CoA dioxygenase family protein [Nocardia seriolae]WKY54735.1 phytanoyl-CoA dioxygenase family protein [Nocardia seriolae]WNJ57069.1 phytanoyl-CoA dioxygenase family protein [Nocardia seriolae]BEK89837.1 phytanoyl-CoA dioxygenase family protein [Nocardia seriolae]BEK94547.1 phytanoyl-CoA dioxygenase family protein [Nocardia seriolae]